MARSAVAQVTGEVQQLLPLGGPIEVAAKRKRRSKPAGGKRRKARKVPASRKTVKVSGYSRRPPRKRRRRS